MPLVLHSDTLARLRLSFEIEVQLEKALLPGGVGDLTLPFGYAGVAASEDAGLAVDLPPGARIVGTVGRAVGGFAETRVVHGSIRPGASTEVASTEGAQMQAALADTVAITSGLSQAQPIVLGEGAGTTVSAVDLLLACVSRKARLQLDLRADADGRPGTESLLSTPVEIALDRTTAGRPTWRSHELPEEVELEGSDGATGWLVLQNLEGEASWPVETTGDPTAALASSPDAIAWRPFVRPSDGGAAMACFRLRRQPERFTMPIELEVGSGGSARRIGFERFAAQGRVDLDLDLPEVATALDAHLTAVATAVPEGEHLANGDFEQWIRDDRLEELWSKSLETLPHAVRVSRDGRRAHLLCTAASSEKGREEVLIQSFEILGGGDVSTPLGGASVGAPKTLAVGADGARVHAALGTKIWATEASGEAPEEPPLDLSSFVVDSLGSLLGKTLLASVMPVLADFLEKVTLASLSGDRLVVALGSRSKALCLLLGIDLGRLELSEKTAEDDSPADSPLLFALLLPHRCQALVAASAGVAAEDRLLLLAKDGPFSRSSLVQLDPSTFSDLIFEGGEPLGLDASYTNPSLLEGARQVALVKSDTAEVNFADLSQREIVARRTLGSALVGRRLRDLVVTPRGDHFVVVSTREKEDDLEVDDVQVHAFHADPGVPAEWQPTGWVRPDPARSGIVILERIQGSDGPASLSQVVPVAPGCDYELSFQAIASKAEAVAEILWLSDAGGVVRTDSSDVRVGPKWPGSLLPHRLRAIAPAKATQAQIRLEVPDGMAHLDSVSLRAISETMTNPTLDVSEEKVEGWNELPVPGTEQALAQTFDVEGGCLFQLSWQGRLLAMAIEVAAKTESDTPRDTEHRPGVAGQVRLRWLTEAGAPVGEPTLLAISPADLEFRAATGTVPDDAVRAEIVLEKPQGATVDGKGVGLRFPKTVQVPLAFLSQAPGELRVSDLAVLYDLPEVPPPPVPEAGLSPPIAPEGEPGGFDPERCHCHRCGGQQTLEEARSAQTDAGRPVRVGRCSGCGERLIQFGGAWAPQMPSLRTLKLPKIRHSQGASLARRARLQPPAPSSTFGPESEHEPSGAPSHSQANRGEPRPLAEAPLVAEIALTQVPGVGAKRAEDLRQVGIDSVAKLASADTRALEGLPGVLGEKAAKSLIDRARRLLKK